MEAEVNLRFAPEPKVVTTVRHALDGLDDLLPPGRLEDVQLVVSELVTNSIRHAELSPHDQISLSVAVSAGSVRGRVCDPGSGFEADSELRPRPGLKGGWGLPIVERMSDRWGVERNSCACVWFEID
jgi:anti-sigma regulatory factor (Ser/Thr protein kinase)